MKFLLDTHAFVWFMNGDDKFPTHLVSEIEKFESNCFLSVASLWEMSIKVGLGKLELRSDFSNILEFCSANKIQLLPISFEHTQKVIGLDGHHRDPFDRMLIAQSFCDQLVIITKDRMFAQYAVETRW